MVRRSEEGLEWLGGKGSHRIQSVFCIVSMYFHRIETTVMITVMMSYDNRSSKNFFSVS